MIIARLDKPLNQQRQPRGQGAEDCKGKPARDFSDFLKEAIETEGAKNPEAKKECARGACKE